MDEEVEILTLTNYINYIETKCADQDIILFRGQRMDKPLLPKIARLSHRITLGESIPDIERQMLEDFKIRSAPLLKQKPKTDWEWLALAQHHGMATRLLDWSLNPLAALWFAIAEPAMKNEKGEPQCAIIWVLKPSPEDRISPSKDTPLFNCENTIAVRTRHITNRIVAQSGWFTIHRYYDEKPYFRPLEHEESYKSKLEKLIIPEHDNTFGNLRYVLDRCAVNHSTILPDLDGLCHYIEWSNIRLEDEMQDLVPPISS